MAISHPLGGDGKVHWRPARPTGFRFPLTAALIDGCLQVYFRVVMPHSLLSFWLPFRVVFQADNRMNDLSFILGCETYYNLSLLSTLFSFFFL